MASPAPAGGSRSRRGKRQSEPAGLHEEELEGNRPRAASKPRGRQKSAGAGPSRSGPAAAQRLAAPHAADLQYASEQIQAYTANAQAESGRTSLSPQEQEKLLREVMRLMLFRQKSQPDVPVPRNDLTKLILANYGNVKKTNVSNAIIALAQESFAKVMGMDMRELKVMPISKGKSKIAESDAAGSKFYVLRSLVPRNWKQKFIAEPEKSPSRHLLVFLLMLIKCHGDKISDEDMWQYLAELGIQQRDEHFELGRVEDQIKSFVQKKYLIQRKQNGTDGNAFSYEAGPNATDEFEGKGGVDAYIEQLFADSLVQGSQDQPEDINAD